MAGINESRKLNPGVQIEIGERLNPQRGFILIDLDKTIIDAQYKMADSSLPGALARAKQSGYRIGLHSDTPAKSLRMWSKELGIEGPNIAELGGIIDFPDIEAQIPLIHGAEEYFETLRHNFINAILHEAPDAQLYIGDPVSLIRKGVHVPPTYPFLVMVNNMTQVSTRIFTRSMDAHGESSLDADFHRKITQQLQQITENNPYEDDELNWDINFEYCLTIVKPAQLNKTTAYQRLIELIPQTELKSFHMIGDSSADYIDDERVTSWAVGNAKHKNLVKAERIASGEYATGVTEIIENILST